MIRVGILGATGYTALELIKLLLRHPEVEIRLLTSRKEDEPHVAQVHPQLAQRLDLHLKNVHPLAVADEVDCIFSCLPHAASAAMIAPVMETETRVIDFSADYRLLDVATYEQWYGGRHPDPERMPGVVYGLPELFAREIATAQLVANPGCYPTSAILPMAPLLREGLVQPHGLIFDSKSGVSGAGRKPTPITHYPECNENIRAYAVGQHRHTPEIEQLLGTVAGQTLEVIFTPHLVPMDRGILTVGYAVPAIDASESEIRDTLRAAYTNCPFVRVVDDLPGTKDVSGTNFCDITARIVGGRVLTISCIDNLVKGASGAAVQNFNVMFGLPETMALL